MLLCIMMSTKDINLKLYQMQWTDFMCNVWTDCYHVCAVWDRTHIYCPAIQSIIKQKDCFCPPYNASLHLIDDNLKAS